jgi:hypothetical protein
MNAKRRVEHKILNYNLIEDVLMTNRYSKINPAVSTHFGSHPQDPYDQEDLTRAKKVTEDAIRVAKLREIVRRASLKITG